MENYNFNDKYMFNVEITTKNGKVHKFRFGKMLYKLVLIIRTIFQI